MSPEPKVLVGNVENPTIFFDEEWPGTVTVKIANFYHEAPGAGRSWLASEILCPIRQTARTDGRGVGMRSLE